jgi:putative membrane protein
MDYYDRGNHGDGRWLVMGLVMLLLWGALIALVVWAVRSYHSPTAPSAGGAARRSEDILAERFARGEIDEQEFRRRRDLLREETGPP